MEDREMTLEEWCRNLPKSHLVNKQLMELKNSLKEKTEPVDEVPCSAGLGRTFMTADNVPILLGMKVYVVNEDKEYFGDDDILEQTVKTLDIAKGFSEYKGEITVGSEDWEGGNLDCYAAPMATLVEEKCDHGKELTDYCEPCGRTHSA